MRNSGKPLTEVLRVMWGENKGRTIEAVNLNRQGLFAEEDPQEDAPVQRYLKLSENP
jgi:hypothetical protein